VSLTVESHSTLGKTKPVCIKSERHPFNDLFSKTTW